MNDVMQRLGNALEGRYTIERELGQGGMATVYLAADIKHDRKVALKVLKPELAAVLGAERFVVEIKTTASLQHPHILPLFDSGEAGGFLFYVMPFIDAAGARLAASSESDSASVSSISRCSVILSSKSLIASADANDLLLDRYASFEPDSESPEEASATVTPPRMTRLIPCQGYSERVAMAKRDPHRLVN